MSDLKEQMLEKARVRMEIIELMVENNAHITDQVLFRECLDRALSLWSILDEADRDYLDAALFAFNEKMTWGTKQPKERTKDDKTKDTSTS